MMYSYFEPWRIEGEFDADTSVTVIDSHEFEVCESVPAMGEWNKDEIARVHLIAAAPELLQALMAARERLFVAKSAKEIVAKCDQAINKAVGESRRLMQ